MYKLEVSGEDDFLKYLYVRFVYATNATRFAIIIGVA